MIIMLCDFLEANMFSLCHFITLIWISTNQMVLRMIGEKLTQGLKKNNLNWNQPKLVACQHEFFFNKSNSRRTWNFKFCKKVFLVLFLFLADNSKYKKPTCRFLYFFNNNYTNNKLINFLRKKVNANGLHH